MRYERVTLKIERPLAAHSASPSNLFSRVAQCTAQCQKSSNCFQKLFRNYLRGKASHLGEPCWVEVCESGEPAPGSRLVVFFGLELIFFTEILQELIFFKHDYYRITLTWALDYFQFSQGKLFFCEPCMFASSLKNPAKSILLSSQLITLKEKWQTQNVTLSKEKPWKSMPYCALDFSDIFDTIQCNDSQLFPPPPRVWSCQQRALRVSLLSQQLPGKILSEHH